MASKSAELTNPQLALAIRLNNQTTLDDFCWNKNDLSEKVLKAFVQNKGGSFVYLWGGSGSGKSHLLQACCLEVQKNTTAMYLPLSSLKEFGPDILENVEDQRLICLDDIESIAGIKAWEEAIFHLYNKIKDKEEGLLLISGKLPPVALNLQLPDLKSRLGWGLVLQIHELEDEDKINSLQHHAKARGFEFPRSVGLFLLKRCARNMHDLYQILDHLDEASLAAQRKITIPFVKSTLQL